MGLNRKVADLAQAGFDVDRLIADRTIPSDGLLWVNGTRLIHVPGEWTAQRVGASDWSLLYNNTTGGAVTRRVCLPISDLMRLTESKGLFVTDVFFAYRLETANATSIDVTVNRITYSNAAPSVASFGGTIADADYDASHNSSAERVATGYHLAIVTLPDPEFQNVDYAFVSAELAAVLPATSKLTIMAAGIHAAHDHA